MRHKHNGYSKVLSYYAFSLVLVVHAPFSFDIILYIRDKTFNIQNG